MPSQPSGAVERQPGRSWPPPALPTTGGRRLAVRCWCGRHVADAFEVDGAWVYATWIGRRSHGRRDRVEAAHHDSAHRLTLADLRTREGEEPGGGVDEGLPASRECGPDVPSRATLLAALRNAERRLTLT